MAHDKCGWKRGEKGERNLIEGPGSVHCDRTGRLPFPATLFYASRPPVKASFLLAVLGLAGARSVMREEFGYEEGMAGCILANFVLLPLVGGEAGRCHEHF